MLWIINVVIILENFVIRAIKIERMILICKWISYANDSEEMMLEYDIDLMGWSMVNSRICLNVYSLIFICLSCWC